ncbi:hypothetical protein [Actinacidiphila oryziradicis]|uniref:Uncharacterized protein n=1 Tax=Actinacidiphila oryziradicis TaxID=2571141 RepID=A0A4U0S9Z5_9ACTN|nr:hypothetical protein [Actinacidiphila oryziradicis]TJZ97134.1 hypothetical protein FCI23_49915 [Actinacidiphila oryziradicis]
MAADIRNTAPFKALAAQTDAELLTRGLEVDPVAVHNVLAHMVNLVADRMGIQPRSALRYVDPSATADTIAKAADPATAGAENVHAVRPVRVDDREVVLPRFAPGRPLMALAQAAKYASGNGNQRITDHALDLITELGAATSADLDSPDMRVAVGVLDEAADILERVAARIETDGWSLCQCGEDHQGGLDTKVAATMRGDADFARQLRAHVDN